MPTFQNIIADVKKNIAEVTPDEVLKRMQAAAGNGASFALIDVREKDEFSGGHLPGAKHIPRGFLELRIEDIAPSRDTSIVIYCQGGTRSALAAESLARLGYTQVESMEGGFGRWKQLDYPWEMPRALTPQQLERYSRHVLIPEVGEEGQLQLLDARVLLLGAGGLGSPAALYLAAAGIGTMGIIDNDVVDESNLQRQVIHTTDRVNTPKVDSAKKTIQNLNPDVNVETYHERLTKDNILPILDQYDIVVDGSDNFATRYLLNDASVFQKKPVVHGSVYRFEGQVTVFDPFNGPCYRCMYPEPPPPEMAPSCAEAGVLGVLPGVVGLLQAVEALKLILGQGEPLVGRILQYDALGATFRTLKTRRDPQCLVCGEDPSITELLEYDETCGIPAP